MSTLVTGMFDNRRDADGAVNALLQRGVTRNDISLLVNERARAEHFPEAAERETTEAEGNKAAEGAGAGAAIGGGLGAVAGALTLAAGNLFLPGVGLLVAGPALAALAGAGAGGLAGGLIGVLVGMGIPEEEARRYEEGLREGRILVGVNVPDSRVAEARGILNAEGARETDSHRNAR